MSTFLYAFKEKSGNRKTNFGTGLFYDRCDGDFTTKHNPHVELVPLLPMVCKNIIDEPPTLGALCMVSTEPILDTRPNETTPLFMARWSEGGGWLGICTGEWFSMSRFSYYVTVYD